MLDQTTQGLIVKLFVSIFLGAGILPALFFSCESSDASKIRILNINEVKAATARPGKVIFLNHWATWCKPCVEELPALAALARKYSDRVEFVGISWDLYVPDITEEEAQEKVVRAFQKASIPYESLLVRGSPEELGEVFALETLVIPQSFLFDRNGKQIASFEVLVEEASLKQVEEKIAEALR